MSLLSRLAVQAARAYGVLNKGGVSASYLVVAGGAGGGSGRGGGGGAGGLLASTAQLSTLTTYTVTVGAGGTAGAPSPSATSGGNGNNSSISGTGLSTITSIGGGGGGSNNAAPYTGVSGGSGGGGCVFASGGAGTAGQGNAGGTGNYIGAFGAGGGGGAGAVGGDAVPAGTTAGAGGVGTTSSISGSSVTYAGGGGGGNDNNFTAGAGGSGGGGAGSASSVGTNGTTNLGGGGGGGGRNASSGAEFAGGAGGSGIVIISYTSATPKFVGGTVTTSGGNQIHTFTSSGTLSPLTPVTASYLVVAGGGGSARQLGGYAGNGGGGAGGLLSGSTTLYSGATYVVTVGAGGAGGTSSGVAPSGSNSVLSGTGLTTQTATGGGGGGGSTGSGANGGSGGGGSGEGTKAGGTGTSGQGNNGGNGVNAGGGGGGSGAAGANAVTTTGGAGGIGTQSSISGTATYYAGGGGGGAYSSGSAGTGGQGGGGNGGAGASNTGNTSGTQNTGGGAGGTAGDPLGATNGQSGGSGTVIISYAGSQVFNGGLVTSSGGNTIHTFNATGALTPLTNNLNNSLRFRRSNNAYLSRTPTVVGNQKTWTYSAWVKRGLLGSIQDIWHANGSGTSENDYFAFDSDTLQFRIKNSNSVVCELITTQVFRDPSAWYHIVAVWDSTQATAANRVKLYVNGNQITAFSTATYPSQNTNTNSYNSTVLHTIGTQWYNSTLSNYLDGYMTDINFIDGQALEPYYFGNNDANGVWKPILYKGTYGTNGFYLTFADASAATAAAIGKDSSGNGNNWTPNNISVTAGSTYDAMLDVPTNTSATVANFPVLSPLNYRTYSGSATPTISNANLTVTQASTTASCIGTATMGVSTSGKYYWEATFVSGNGSNNSFLGVVAGQLQNTTPNDLGYYSNEYAYKSGNGYKYTNNTNTAYGSSYTSGDVIGFALDLDAGTLTFYKNNTSQGVAFSGLSASETYFPAFDTYYNNTFAYNFGQRPFSYTPPTGFVRLNTFNLPTPTILQGNKHMDATLYTGNLAATQVIVNQGQFKPDLVWGQARSAAYGSWLFDSVRGATKQIASFSTNAESTQSTMLTAFNNNGFNMGSDTAGNNSGVTFVGWQWQAGQGTTSSNTSGTITSTVSVNTTAGFSIVTYTGTGANATVGHGLGVAPKMVIVKNRTTAGDEWCVWHTSLTNATYYLYLNGTAAQAVDTTFWNSTAPSSTVISLGSNGRTNRSSSNMVCYAWSEIAGFSKFGSYTGNGSADGVFVYTGFRPKFIITKVSSTSGYNWNMYDSSRGTYNAADQVLVANGSGAEETGFDPIDFLSNGFKLRMGNRGSNVSGATYIYMAFAEHPFKNSNAR